MSKVSRTFRRCLPLASLLFVLSAASPTPAHAALNPADAWPRFAFTLAPSLNVYWLPQDQAFVYYGNGEYFRWQAGHWIHAAYFAGPWKPLARGYVLPQALDYGPPPPVHAGRAYFFWWQKEAAPWWRLNHPRWWAAYHADLLHYRLWVQRALPAWEAGSPFWKLEGGSSLHPDFRPAHPDLTTELPRQVIRTPHLSDRYYRGERNAYEWTHPWQTFGRDREGWGYPGISSAYPLQWAPPVFEWGVGNPWMPWMPPGGDWNPVVPAPGFWYFQSGENQPLSPWMGNPIFAPMNTFPYPQP